VGAADTHSFALLGEALEENMGLNYVSVCQGNTRFPSSDSPCPDIRAFYRSMAKWKTVDELNVRIPLEHSGLYTEEIISSLKHNSVLERFNCEDPRVIQRLMCNQQNSKIVRKRFNIQEGLWSTIFQKVGRFGDPSISYYVLKSTVDVWCELQQKSWPRRKRIRY